MLEFLGVLIMHSPAKIWRALVTLSSKKFFRAPEFFQSHSKTQLNVEIFQTFLKLFLKFNNFFAIWMLINGLNCLQICHFFELQRFYDLTIVDVSINQLAQWKTQWRWES